MSRQHPIISVTGSSGSGTTTVKHTFEQIFRRERIEAAYIEGDAFHRYDRAGMTLATAEAAGLGNNHLSHFSLGANLLDELADVFRTYAETGRGRTRHYVHDDEEAERLGAPAGTFTPWAPFADDTDLCSMKACLARS
jgi:phosphoribulokinase